MRCLLRCHPRTSNFYILTKTMVKMLENSMSTYDDAPDDRQRDGLLLSLVVPCYNEEKVIRMTHDRIVGALGMRQDFRLQVVYVDDGSRDDTLSILTEIAVRDERVVVLSLSRNFGHQPAVSAGLEEASGDMIAVIDADLQDPPEVILGMVDLWRQGNDVIYGVRAERKEGFLKTTAYSLFYRLYRLLSHVEVPLDSGDFALMDRRVVDVMLVLPENNRFLRGLRSWSGFRQTGLIYERHARAAGETKYPLSKLIKLAADGIFNFSTTPLSVVFIAGFTMAMLSFLLLMGVIVLRLADVEIMGHSYRSVPGNASVILLLLFLGGVQMAALGIVGEYIGRIYTEVKRRPNFVVNQVIKGRKAMLRHHRAEGGRD